MPGAPLARRSRHCSVAHSIPVTSTACSSSWKRCRRERRAGGSELPHMAANLSTWATLVTGMIPGTMGTWIPAALALAT